MSVLNMIKRRLSSKIHPIFKRVVLPMGVVILVLQVLTWTDGDPNLLTPGVLPGEALDPLVKPRHRHPHDKRPTNAFETVLRGAAEVDQMREETAVAPKPSLAEDDKLQKRELKKKKKDSATKKEFPKEKKVIEKEIKGEKTKHDADGWSMAKANIPGKEKVRFQGHAISDQTVTLTVMSSSDKVFMSLNKREIYRGLDERGMHIVVLHPHTGKVMTARVFDTFYNGTEDEMVHFLDNIQDGRFVVFAVRDEAATGLTWKGRGKLKQMGARFSDKLAYRDMWVLVTRTGGLKLAESYSNVAVEDTAYEWGGPLFLRTDFDLDTTSDLCKWDSNYLSDMRQRFCQRFEGYGDMCKCSVKHFSDIFFKTDPKIGKELSSDPLHEDLAVAVLASNRPDYLYRTLKALREAPGVRPDRIVVFVEKEMRELSALVKLFSVQLMVTGYRQTNNVTVTQRVRDKVQYIFRTLMGASFPEAKVPADMHKLPAVHVLSCNNLVILEDDLQVSNDFFKYLYAVAPVLKRDPTIVGISTFNYNSYTNVANSLSTSYRTDRLQTLGLMIPVATLNQYLIPDWPDIDSKDHWHQGLDVAMEKQSGLAFVYPEISRCKHFGYRGYRIKGSLQQAFFADHKISLTTDYKIRDEEIQRLEQHSYNIWQMEQVKASEPASMNFCKYSYPYGDERVVVFVNFNGQLDDDVHLVATLKCLGAWHLYAEGQWQNTWHFHYHGHPFTLVGVPASPYSNLMPTDYRFTDMTGPENAKPSP